ncbi:MAG: T9SS type A sorting domain-containing protein [Chitinophagales bacterium]|nr:T9SS type A sorting domain-containing protein [Chitinophagales bacterium]
MTTKTILFNCILIIALSFFFQIVRGQIVYTNVTPDFKLSATGIYPLDLNNDGTVDFNFNLAKATGCNGTNFSVSLGDTLNEVVDSIGETGEGVKKLELNVIDSTLFWTDGSDLYSRSCFTHQFGCQCPPPIGFWSQSTSYAALRLNWKGYYYYGWVKIKVADPFSITLFDYAYNSIPNQSILAGDTGAVITDIHQIKIFSSIAVSPNTFQHVTRISFSTSVSEKTSILIYDLTGRIVKILADEVINTGTHELQWDATDQNGNDVGNGIYLLKLQTANKSETICLNLMR